MREIKFRLWIEQEKIMFYPNKQYPIYIDNGEWDKGQIPMQYTGLKDKNGKELYEGDIYRETRRNMTNGNTYKVIREATYKTLEIFKGDILSDLVEWEIIGNIYENPELLKTF